MASGQWSVASPHLLPAAPPVIAAEATIHVPPSGRGDHRGAGADVRAVQVACLGFCGGGNFPPGGLLESQAFGGAVLGAIPLVCTLTGFAAGALSSPNGFFGGIWSPSDADASSATSHYIKDGRCPPTLGNLRQSRIVEIRVDQNRLNIIGYYEFPCFLM